MTELTTIAELMAAHLNSSPENWGGDAGIEVKTELDPLLCMLPELGVYIVPVTNNYSFQGSHTRGSAKQIYVVSFCSLIVSKVFEDLPTGVGVTSWEEAKQIVDIRQQAELFLMKLHIPGLTLEEIESSDMEEVQMDVRNFAAITNFGYGQTICV